MITQEQFKIAADIIGCEPATIKAVYEVEAAGRGYLLDGRVKILFEGHRFWKQLIKVGVNPSAFIKTHSEYKLVLYQSWTKINYVGGVREWNRMSSAIEVCKIMNLSPELALLSASYGSFQIMGENFAACGYLSAQDMISNYNMGGEAEQLNSFIRFVKKNHLDDELISKNWDAFAKGYNGTAYRLNNYHKKLYIAYLKYI